LFSSLDRVSRSDGSITALHSIWRTSPAAKNHVSVRIRVSLVTQSGSLMSRPFPRRTGMRDVRFERTRSLHGSGGRGTMRAWPRRNDGSSSGGAARRPQTRAAQGNSEGRTSKTVRSHLIALSTKSPSATLVLVRLLVAVAAVLIVFAAAEALIRLVVDEGRRTQVEHAVLPVSSTALLASFTFVAGLFAWAVVRKRQH
jgi:hypothetical protein